MRIVHVIYSMNTGGAELMLTDIANAQAEAGHEVVVLVINNSTTPEVISRLSDKVELRLLKRPEGSRNPLWILRFNRELRRLNPDVVHMHNDSIMCLVLKSRKTRYVGTIHIPGINVRHFKRADRIFAISQAVKDDMKNRLNIESTVIVNGVEFGSIEQNTRKKPNEPLRIVQAGRVEISLKGQDILIRAIALLKQQGLNAVVDFIGEPFDAGQLKSLAGELGIADNICFLGRQSRSDLYRRLKDYDIAVQPSRIEGFGLTLVEAMAAKIPVIASNIEGPAEILQDNRYGLLFESENPQDLADAIARVYNTYPIFKANAETAAYRHAVENYSIDSTARNYLNAYHSLIQGRE